MTNRTSEEKNLNYLCERGFVFYKQMFQHVGDVVQSVAVFISLSVLVIRQKESGIFSHFVFMMFVFILFFVNLGFVSQCF